MSRSRRLTAHCALRCECHFRQVREACGTGQGGVERLRPRLRFCLSRLLQVFGVGNATLTSLANSLSLRCSPRYPSLLFSPTCCPESALSTPFSNRTVADTLCHIFPPIEEEPTSASQPSPQNRLIIDGIGFVDPPIPGVALSALTTHFVLHSSATCGDSPSALRGSVRQGRQIAPSSPPMLMAKPLPALAVSPTLRLRCSH